MLGFQIRTLDASDEATGECSGFYIGYDVFYHNDVTGREEWREPQLLFCPGAWDTEAIKSAVSTEAQRFATENGIDWHNIAGLHIGEVYHRLPNGDWVRTTPKRQKREARGGPKRHS